MRLTVASIKNAKPGDLIRDDIVRGLQLRAFAGRKSFYFYYRPKSGIPAERRPKIGDWPTITLESARTIAQEWASMVARGVDPVEERSRTVAKPTLSELCSRYLVEHADAKKKPASIRKDRKMIETLINPNIGKVLISDLDYAAVQRLHQSLRDTPYQANRVLALLSKMMNLAELWRLRDPYSNPCRFVSRFREKKRERYMTGAEAPRIAELLDQYKVDYPQAVFFIYLLILTGARPSEIETAKPEWVKGDHIALPDSKTGERNIWIPPVVQELIKRIPTTRRTLTGIKSPRHVWNEIRVLAGCPDLRLYDLRHTFASAALASGYSLLQIGKLLGHSSPMTTNRYAHMTDSGAAQMVEVTADYLQGIMKAS